ncbi:hypothetical protein niasHT_031951 [Heterodera trifolii]|uniref:Uncharacterized protein n=1 Tax=Heterodera trifolii TaxID=157864 RepID=A0ABD2HUR3_9BILA
MPLNASATLRHRSANVRTPCLRIGRSPSDDLGGGRSAAPIKQTELPCLTAAAVANRRLGQAPAFFSRTVSTSLSGMPSTSLGESSSLLMRLAYQQQRPAALNRREHRNCKRRQI